MQEKQQYELSDDAGRYYNACTNVIRRRFISEIIMLINGPELCGHIVSGNVSI